MIKFFDKKRHLIKNSILIKNRTSAEPKRIPKTLRTTNTRLRATESSTFHTTPKPPKEHSSIPQLFSLEKSKSLSILQGKANNVEELKKNILDLFSDKKVRRAVNKIENRISRSR